MLVLDKLELNAALAFLHRAYDRRCRRTGRLPDHPVAVAELLAGDGQPGHVVVIGLLHDVLEDTDVGRDELARRFGPEIVRIVVALTQDDDIPEYRERKAALRAQILDAGADAASVALADKLAKVRQATQTPKPRQIAHYRATLEGIEALYGPSRLGTQLRRELDRLTRG